MRKLYYSLIVLLVQLFSSGVYAQSDLLPEMGDPLITDISQLSSNASDRDEGQHLEYLIDGDPDTHWHSDYHGEVTDPHYLQVKLLEPISSGNLVVYIQRRGPNDQGNDPGNHFTKARLSASADGETWEDLADLEFNDVTLNAGVFSQPVVITKEYSYFRFTNTTPNLNFFHMAEFGLYTPEDWVLVPNVLNEILLKYDNIYWAGIEDMNVGTGFGQYSDEETAYKLIEIVGNVVDWMDNPDAEDYPSLAEAMAIAEEIDALYAKYLASVVPYSIPEDGYYRIISNLPYRKNIDTGEKDEGGNIIYETEYVTKAMFCSLDYKARWGNINTDLGNYIWKLTQKGDLVDMVNAGMGTRFSYFGTSVRMTEDATTLVSFDYAGNEDGRDVFYIRSSEGQRDGSDYLHQLGHGRGAEMEDRDLCIWQGTFNMGRPYESDKGTSEWYLERVSDEEAQQLIEAFQPIKNHDLLVEQNNNLRNEIKQAIETAKDYINEPLITEAGQMTSPFSQNDLAGQDGGNLSDGVLIDGDANTYWHSVYSNGDVEQGSHYVQLSGIEKMVGRTKIYVHRRSSGAPNHVKEFTVRASNDPDAADEDWTTITVQTIGNDADGQEFTTPFFDAGETPYSYVRLYATKNTFWHCAEIQIYSVHDNPNSQFAALGELGTTLENTLNENLAKADADITIEDYEALLAAYEAFQGGVVDPTELRNALAAYADADNGYTEGTTAGFWSDSKAKDTYRKLYDEVSAYDKAGRYTANQNRRYAAALKLAVKNIWSSANKVQTDRWYSIKLAPESLYDENEWDKTNMDDDKVTYPLYENYACIGNSTDLGDNYFNFWAMEDDEVREGSGIYFIDKSDIDDIGCTEATKFRFIPTTNEKIAQRNISDLIQLSRDVIAMNSDYTYGKDLITSKSQLSSNASDMEEGAYIEYLIDGNVNTFWHSSYHENDGVTSPHYIQVTLPEAVSGAIQVRMTRRQNIDYGDPRRMYVIASNDGEAWDNVGYVEFPFGKAGETILSDPIYLGGSYTQLRFILAQRGGDNTDYDPFDKENWTFFHVAEFQVRSINTASEPTPAVAALTEAVRNAVKVLHKNITSADYTPLAEAYNAVRDEVNAGENPVVPAIKENAADCYVLQHKVNGLFVYAGGSNSNALTLELMPTFLEPTAVGFGELLFQGTNLDGTWCSYLHAQKRNHRLVTWNDTRVGSNSGLMLEEADENDQNEFTLVKEVKTGHIYNWCYPVALTNDSEGSIYTVAGTYTTADNEVYLALNDTETIKPGQPALYILGLPEEWTADVEGEENERTLVEFLLNSEDISFEAGSENGLTGAMVTTHVEPGTLVFNSNTIDCVESKNGADVPWARAYLNFSDVPTVDEDGDYSLCIDITEAANATGVEDIVAKVSRTGNIYTLDGRLVRQHGTMNDLKQLGRGTYILNGVKVLVK